MALLEQGKLVFYFTHGADNQFVSLEGGVSNLFDRNYALAEGFAEPGRNFFVNLVLSNL